MALQAKDSRFTPALCEAIQDLLRPSNQDAPLNKWNTLKEKLKDAGITYEQKNVAPDLMMIHNENRGGLGLGMHAVHKLGSKIIKTGASWNTIGESVAFEIPVEKKAAEKFLHFNQDLHVGSVRKVGDKTLGWLLPKVLGKERFVAVSSCHTVTFCKAALQGCVTEDEFLKNYCHGGTTELSQSHLADRDAILRRGKSFFK